MDESEFDGGEYYTCTHPMHSKKHEIDDRLYFPFYPAPGCFIPNELYAPDRFNPDFDCNQDNFYEWLGAVRDNVRKWSGDAIEIV
jgi:hypothetical protein